MIFKLVRDTVVWKQYYCTGKCWLKFMSTSADKYCYQFVADTRSSEQHFKQDGMARNSQPDQTVHILVTMKFVWEYNSCWNKKLCFCYHIYCQLSRFTARVENYITIKGSAYYLLLQKNSLHAD
jgi:hypothetical protein